MSFNRSKSNIQRLAFQSISRWRWVIWIAGIAILLVLNPFRHRYFSVCDRCGVLRRTECREFLLIEVPYWCSMREEGTLLSRTVAQLGLIEPHDHHWQYGAGGRLFSLTYNGPGVRTFPVLKSDLISTFLENTQRHAGVDAAADWLSYLLNGEYRNRVPFVLELTHFPKTGFTSAVEYRQWRARADEELHDWLGNPPADSQTTIEGHESRAR